MNNLYMIYQLLLSRSLSALIFFLILIAATYCIKQRSIFWNYSLWTLFFIKLVFPSVINPLFSIQQLFGNLFWIISQRNQPVPAQVSASFLSQGLETTVTGSAVGFINVIMGIWLTGFVLLLIRYVHQRCRWCMHVKKSQFVRDSDVLSLVEYWRKRLKIRRRIHVKVSDEIHSPFTLGIFGPAIILPRNGLLVQKSLESIVAHECAHIKRLDDLQITGQTLIQILFFFHPAVWIAAHKLNNARECMCDSRVLAQNVISRQAYGQGLITWLKTADLVQPKTVLFFGGRKSALKQRIQNIKERRMKSTWKQVFMLALVTIIALPAAARDTGGNGSFTAPLPSGSYRISAKFGPMIDPFTGKERMHKGIDLAAAKGTPVLAVEAGVVTKAVSKVKIGEGSGRFIEIKHKDGFSSRYTMLSKLEVKVDDRVNAGDRIGLVGSSGRSTGPHLHFEIWNVDNRVDPELYITF